VSARGPGRVFLALSVHNYRLFYFGQIISLSGTWMQTIAQAWLVLDLTNSPLALGTVTMLQFLPITLLALFGGVLADRLPKRRVLMLTQISAAMQALILATLVLSGAIQLWHIYLLALMLGLTNALDMPTRQSFVVEMVGKEYLTNAVALNSTVFNGARVVGPTLGGLTIAAIGVGGAFLLNGLSFLASISALLLMRDSELRHVERPARGNVLGQLAEGIRYAFNTREIFLIIIAMASLGTFGYNFSTMLPLIARFILHIDALGFGSLFSAMGAGSVIGALVVAYFGRSSKKTLFAASMAFSLVLICIALSTWYALTLVLFAALGLSSITFSATANTRLQLLVPDELRGRVMSMYTLLFAGTTPIGAVIIGGLASRISVSATITLMGCLCAAGTLLALSYSRPFRQAAPQPAATPGGFDSHRVA